MDTGTMMIGLVVLFSAMMIVTVMTTIVAFGAWVELRSFMKSTHKVEFIPLDHNQESIKESDRPRVDEELEDYDL